MVILKTNKTLNADLIKSIKLAVEICGGDASKFNLGSKGKITQDEANFLRICLKYIQLDLEASRREIVRLRKLLQIDDS